MLIKIKFSFQLHDNFLYNGHIVCVFLMFFVVRYEVTKVFFAFSFEISEVLIKKKQNQYLKATDSKARNRAFTMKLFELKLQLFFFKLLELQLTKHKRLKPNRKYLIAPPAHLANVILCHKNFVNFKELPKAKQENYRRTSELIQLN